VRLLISGSGGHGTRRWWTPHLRGHSQPWRMGRRPVPSRLALCRAL